MNVGEKMHEWVVPRDRPWFKKGIWPERVPKSLEYRRDTLAYILERTAERVPQQTALIFFGKKISFKELDDLSNRFANALIDLGVEKGDRVSLLLPNSPQFVISYFGTLKAGATVVPLNPLHTERELEYQLNDTAAETIVTTNAKLTLPKIMRIKDKTRLKRIIVTGLNEYLPFPLNKLYILAARKELVKFPRKGDGIFYFKDLMKHPPEKPKVKVDPDDIAVIQFTGGTTGPPKGCMLTHFSMLANVYQIMAYTVQYFPEDRYLPLPDEFKEFLPADEFEKYVFPKDRRQPVLGILPLFHIYGMTTIMNAAIASATPIILFPRPDLKRILKAIQKYKPDVFPSITTLLIDLMEHPDVKKYDLTSIGLTSLGAMTVPPRVQEEWSRITKGHTCEGYGLSEASPATHLTPAHLKKPKSFGIPLPDTDVKIVDLETGEELPPGKEGEICIRGPQVMKGYWNRPEETREALKDGWLHTGDVGKMDEDGFFYFVERKKDMIKYKGYMVSPAEVEKVISEHPAVSLCAVIGIPDERVGEIPKAFVVLKDEYKGKVSEQDIIDFCAERIAPYKKVREVEFRDDLPKSMVGKVLRRVLREEEKEKLKEQ
jgi:long-chain acyl-CoA synthetase